MSEIYTAQGERSTLGIGKETNFGVKATPSIWHAFQQLGMKPVNTAVPLTGARGSLGQKYPGTGGRSFSGSLDVDGEVDTIGQLLAYTMGAQTNPSNANLFLSGVTLATNMATAATTFTVTAPAPYTGCPSANMFPGMGVTIGSDTLTIASVSGNTVTTTTGATAQHTSGSSVTSGSTPNAYKSILTMGTLQSFTMQINRAGAAAGSSLLCDNFLGCKMDGMTLALSAKKGLQPKFNLVSQQMLKELSPTAAVISTRYPIQFEQQFAAPMWNATAIGTGIESSVISANLTVANNLMKDYFSLGNGNLVRSFPEQKRQVSGSLVLGMETTTLHDAFNAAAAGGALPSAAVFIPLYGTDLIAAGNTPYAVSLYLPNCFLTGWDAGDKSTGAQQQTVTFTAAESSPGAQDDLTIFLLQAATAVY